MSKTSPGKAISNYIKEGFDPYLCYVLIDGYNKKMGKKLLSNKLDLAKLVMNEYRKNLQFKDYIERALFNVYDTNKITDLVTRRRIIDMNLLYCLKLHFQINIGTKSGGRALELIVESILKSKLQKPNNFDYEFVDWKEVDYFIIDKKINDWVMGIQCKMALHTTKGYLNYQQVLKKLEAFAKGFGIKKTLVIVCGVAVGYRGQDYTQQKEQIRQTFEKEGWKFYYLFNNDVGYLVDNSFYDFINLIESYV